VKIRSCRATVILLNGGKARHFISIIDEPSRSGVIGKSF